MDLNSRRRKFALMLVKPNGVLAIGPNGAAVTTTESYRPTDVTTAMQSGPMLVIGGRTHPAFAADSSNRAIRSGVGINETGAVVFVLSETPVTFYEFASLFRDSLRCSHALYLDGTLSRFFVDGVDTPTDADAFATMLVVTSP